MWLDRKSFKRKGESVRVKNTGVKQLNQFQNWRPWGLDLVVELSLCHDSFVVLAVCRVNSINITHIGRENWHDEGTAIYESWPCSWNRIK